MGVSEYIKLILNVLKDFRVIITVVLMILVIEFAKFITSYRKKPPKPKKVKAPKEAPAPEKKEESGGETAPDMSESDAE